MVFSLSLLPQSSIHARFKHCPQQAHAGAAFCLDVDITLPSAGVTAIFGPSGSGKTTLLRCIAGLEVVSQGECTVNGESWQSQANRMPVHRRAIGFVFQEASLFAHLTAQANLQYAIKRAASKTRAVDYEQVVDVMALSPLLARYPHELSGGERQRVAIARALLAQPRLLLMDEPLASLDRARKQEILPYLEHLRAVFNVPIIYVTHSLEEVARLADQVVLMEQGKVVSQGDVADVFSRLDVALWLNDDMAVVLKGVVVERDAQWHLMRVQYSGGHLWLRDSGAALSQTVRIRIHAKDVSLTLAEHQDTSIANRLNTQVVDIVGDQDEAMSLIRLASGSDYLMARVTKRSVEQLGLKVGMSVWAQVKSAAMVG